MSEKEKAENDEELLELAAHYAITGEYACDDLHKNKKRAVRRKAVTLVVERGEVFVKRHGRVVKV